MKIMDSNRNTGYEDNDEYYGEDISKFTGSFVVMIHLALPEHFSAFPLSLWRPLSLWTLIKTDPFLGSLE
jgi:hypothetical protein